MTKPTHILISFTITSLFSMEPGHLALSLLAPLPDVDQKLKKFGMKHRTWTHSLFIAIPLLIVLYFYIGYLTFYVGIAYLSHIFSDMLTKSHVAIFYPIIKKPFSFFGKNKGVRVGSRWETLILFILTTFFLFKCMYYYYFTNYFS